MSANLNQIIHPRPKKCQYHLVKTEQILKDAQESKLLDTTMETSWFSNLPAKGQHRTKTLPSCLNLNA